MFLKMVKLFLQKLRQYHFNKQKRLTREIKKAKILGLLSKMDVNLLENILNLGSIGDKVKVKDSFARNFLLKQGKALRFNKKSKFVNK